MDITKMIEGNIIQRESVVDWEDAIKIISQPLIKKEIITPAYIDAVIQNVYENGTYMVLFDYFAIPHARPEKGSLKVGLSFLKLINPVLFVDKEVKYFLLFSSGSIDGHMELIRTLGKVLGDEDLILEQLEKATTEQEIINVFKGE